MTDWIRFFDQRVAAYPETDFLGHVGHTLNGAAVCETHFNLMKDDIIDRLDLTAGDRLLDLCCGNGVFTRPLAEICGTATAVDISPALIALAEKHHPAPGLNYIVGSLEALRALPIAPGTQFNKLVMNAALQHFTPAQFGNVLDQILDVCAEDFRFFVALIPEKSKRWNFYNTWPRRARYIGESLVGKHQFGDWWRPAQIERLCRERGLEFELLPVPEDLDAARYRFNACISRQGPASR